jgi:hypothetical protein
MKPPQKATEKMGTTEGEGRKEREERQKKGKYTQNRLLFFSCSFSQTFL